MSDPFFRGYVQLVDGTKRPAQKIKDAELRTIEEVSGESGYAGILSEGTVLIDIDDMATSELVMDVVEELQLGCRVVQTARGKHLYFRGHPKGMRCGTGRTLACGIKADVKVGEVTAYAVLKSDGAEREVIYDVYPGEDYDPLPAWLRPVKGAPDFSSMGEGDGRNQALFNYILTLQSSGFTKEEARETLRCVSRHFMADPLPERELETVYRDEAFANEVFYDGRKFLFDRFAQYMISEHRILRISGQLHIYRDGVYEWGDRLIEHAMISHLPMLTKANRSEVMAYMDVLVTEETEPASADKVAFRNGVYDLSSGTFGPASPDVILTNRIDWDYDPSVRSDLADHVLHRLACGDEAVYELLEECVGYLFYRRNELRKCFILTGDKHNGKSTFLDMVKTLLGDRNTSALDLRELGDRFKTAELAGKLANVGDDIGEEFIANPAIFKKLVSGDRVNAERKGKDPFDFSSYAKLLFSANSMPRIKDRTGAVLDRIILVPFKASFTADDPDFDPYIKYKLRSPEVMSHLINVGLRGLRRVLERQRFTVPEVVERELDEYAMTNNPVLEFLRDLSEADVVNQPTSAVFDDYMAYAVRANVKPLSQNELTKQVKKHLGLEAVTRRVGGKRIRIFVKTGGK